MARAIRIVIEYSSGKKKTEVVRSVDEAFRLCRTSGGSSWKPVSYRPHIHRVAG